MDGHLGLRIFWWLALGALVAAIGVVLGGRLGITILLHYLGRDEEQRRKLLERVASGSGQYRTWTILSGGAVAAAWAPLLGMTLFSGLWLVLLFFVIAVLVGPVAQNLRNRPGSSLLRRWDALWAVAALASLLVFGIGAGVMVSGAPFGFDSSNKMQWTGFFSRFTPYEVLIPGLLAIAAGIWLAAARVSARCDGEVAIRAHRLLLPSGAVVLLLFVAGAAWSTQLTGYVVAGMPTIGSGPLHGPTFAVGGAYLQRFMANLGLAAVPVLAGLSLAGALFYAWRGRVGRVWPLAAAGVTGMVATAGIMTYPVIVPSFAAPAASLTWWNAIAPMPIQIGALIFLGLLVTVAGAYQIRRRPLGRDLPATGNASD